MLSKTEQQFLIELISKGESIPAEFRDRLFPAVRKEYELVYDGKERPEDIVADTMAVPLQPIRQFGEIAQGHWANMLIFGDNLQTLKTLLRLKMQGKLVNTDGSHGVKLVYIDPPFSTDQDFKSSSEAKAYQDRIAGARFLEFLRKRLVLLKELLADNGSIYVHLDWRKGHYIKVLLDEVFGEHNFRNEIIWQRTSARSDSRTYNHIHDIIFFYSKGSVIDFQTQYIGYSANYVKKFYRYSEPDGRVFSIGDLTARGRRNGETGQLWRGVDPNLKGNHWKVPPSKLDDLDRQGRIYWPPKGRVPRLKQYLDERKGVPLQTIWTDISPVQYASKENFSYPTQKPEKLLEYIIASSSRPGDIVLDAFAGSGTTLAVAEKLGRKWIGIDCGKLSIYTIQKRLLSLGEEIGNKGEKLEPKPFTLYNAGLYDFSRLKSLPWEDWRIFALTLFQCIDDPHVVGGVKIDGYKNGADVLVFNYRYAGGIVLDYGFIDDLHAQIGERLGSHFFIIVPAASVSFLEDYIDRGGVRYFILRIPYSIINELHTRNFEAIVQPISQKRVNETVNAVGFDFMRPPTIKCDYRLTESESHAEVEIKVFHSEALIRGSLDQPSSHGFSMVMVDFNYDYRRHSTANAQPFVLDQVFFAEDIIKNDWRFSFPIGGMGDYVMFIFVDVYGNEHTEVKQRCEFVKAVDKNDS